ncbi:MULTISPECIES: amidohydrolase [unclassified Paenibacillus]|uniref:amidohydrolase n=1 Tax=unclassified Paenibacillus TaxID=185978 RepID=UPI002406319F|nr:MULTISPECIES: amidohydrolase [unclassified Paenibacillus]MDF9841637.1 aminobenzoyl-glutamate utilization protein A [Paenibacillus sp. PastF-2]MDF9848251.1 aminobenzoyl-glutamate utilization protein A [Paenibacillus sp. PastM-2]MDF9854796.1 aminobenzoyl-glutamate utilization protein A [Paenibacillus sp. PastF-1]MDH6480066.1 aminobenzoyl-glutamate utilization protein A [Paenibacillus sp. PastH-2]MDH6507499.1 aminobenzoyl-glutamate utilization protein A [Paenibacillus sp. PastM-3]
MDIIALRRDLHAHPEVGFTEFRTASIVAGLLSSWGYTTVYGPEALDGAVRKGVPPAEILESAYERALEHGANPDLVRRMKGGYTAVVGILEGKRPGPVAAFRFDMDALPVAESQKEGHLPHREGFSSRYSGLMHACGHDGHTAIGLGLAEKMADREFSGTLKLIFQPAEEGVRGAEAVVSKGWLDDADYLFCQHLATDAVSGQLFAGALGFLATTKLTAHFKGVSSHAGAAPELGRNALLGAATALLNIHAIPRNSGGQTFVNVGVLQGGTAANIVPDYARLVLECRSDSAEINSDLERRIRRILQQSAEMYELACEVEVTGAAIPIHCDEAAVRIVAEEAAGHPRFSSISERAAVAIGSEDAGFMMQRVQQRGGISTYMIIGSDRPAAHHHPEFDIDEAVLEPAVDLLAGITRRVLV